MSNTTPTPKVAANSAGSFLSGQQQLDSHYLLAKAEYDACIASVGIQPGWRVLDAGCGTGTFLPHLSELVGDQGVVVALDHAAESIEVVRNWIAAAQPSARFETHIGALDKLPFDDATFDCVWCANTVQYLTVAEYEAALSEFIRVLKPGGLLAIKEMDLDYISLHPINPQLRWRLLQVVSQTMDLVFLRKGTTDYGVRMRTRGLTLIQSRTTLVERAAPLHPEWRPYLTNMYRFWAQGAQKLEQLADDHAAWAEIDDSIETILDSPDARYREIFMLFVGQKPV